MKAYILSAVVDTTSTEEKTLTVILSAPVPKENTNCKAALRVSSGAVALNSDTSTCTIAANAATMVVAIKKNDAAFAAAASGLY